MEKEKYLERGILSRRDFLKVSGLCVGILSIGGLS